MQYSAKLINIIEYNVEFCLKLFGLKTQPFCSKKKSQNSSFLLKLMRKTFSVALVMAV